MNDTSTPQSIADWVELCVAWQKKDLSKSKLCRLLAAADVGEPDDTLIDNVWEELTARRQLYGKEAPYLVTSRLIKPAFSWIRRPEYLFMLALSYYGNPVGKDKHVPTGRLFEKLTKEAVCRYLRGDAVIYGFPKNIDVKTVAAMISEGFLKNPTIPQGDQKNDIVAWIDTGDGRKTKVIILMQCAAGENWRSKLLEPSIDLWKSYIDFGAYMPMKGFSLPRVVEQNEFITIAKQAGFILDRPRLFRYTSMSPNKWRDAGLQKELAAWCRIRLPELTL